MRVMGDMVAVVLVAAAAMEAGRVVMTSASGVVTEVAAEALSLEVEGDMVVQGGAVGIILMGGRKRFSRGCGKNVAGKAGLNQTVVF